MKYIVTLVLCLFIFNVNGQSSYFDVLESKKYNDHFKTTTIRSVNTSDNNHTIIARTTLDNLIFETFNENAKGKKVLIKEFEKKEVFASELFYDNKVKIFTVTSPSRIDRVVNCHIYDALNYTYKKIELFKTTVEKRRLLFSNKNKRSTNFAISPNNNLIAIATDITKENSNSYLVHVFNAQTLKLVYSKNYYTNPENYFESTDMAIDNNGNVFSVGKEYKIGKRERKNAQVNYSLVLSRVSEDNFDTQKIELGEKEYIKNLTITFNEKKVNLFGYYAEKRANRIKGICQIKVNQNNLSVLHKKNTEIPLEVYKNLFGYYADYEKGKGLRNFALDHVLSDKDGNTFFDC